MGETSMKAPSPAQGKVHSHQMRPLTNFTQLCLASRLVFKPAAGQNGPKELTRDAMFVCKLLAIDPNDLLFRPYESFAEKGLTEGRQKIRYEHFEDKRLLKVKAIENVLQKCQSKDYNQEGLQVQALLEDMKRSKSNMS